MTPKQSRNLVGDFRMPAKRKRRWIAALRSGKYKQGQGRLKTGTGEYCCLGVACAIRETRPGASGGMVHNGTVRRDFAPARIQSKLMRWNDAVGRAHKSFKQIAVWVERYL